MFAHDDVIKWKHFPRYWPFVRGIHRSPVNSPHKGQWRWAFMFSLICAWIDCCVNNREAGDLRCYRIHYDVIVMKTPLKLWTRWTSLKRKYQHFNPKFITGFIGPPVQPVIKKNHQNDTSLRYTRYVTPVTLHRYVTPVSIVHIRLWWYSSDWIMYYQLFAKHGVVCLNKVK